MEADPEWLNISRYGGGAFAAKEIIMQRTPFIFLVLLTMSAASSAATDDVDSFLSVGWVWILALSLYAVLAVIILAMCKMAAASDALEDKTYAAILKEAGARQARSNLDSRHAGHPSLWPDSLCRLNRAECEAEFLDVHILSGDEIVVRVDAAVTRA